MPQLLSNILHSNNSLLVDSVSITASDSQTTFNADYTAPMVEVYLNGVKLIKNTDYAATNGSTIVLTSGAANNDIIEVVKLKAGNIYGESSIVAGTNLSGGGSISGGNNVTLSLGTSLTSLTSVQTETLTNASGNLLVDATTYKTEFRGGGSTEGQIQLNCQDNSHGQTIKPQPHSASVTNELTLPAGSNQELVGTSATQTLSAKTLNAATLNGSTTINGATTANSLTVTASTTSANTYSNTYVESIKTVSQPLSSQAVTLDISSHQNFEHQLANNVTYTFANPPSSAAFGFTLKVTQDAGASGYTITWPTSVDWPSATAPTLTATANAVDMFVFSTNDGGTTYYGFVAGQALG